MIPGERREALAITQIIALFAEQISSFESRSGMLFQLSQIHKGDNHDNYGIKRKRKLSK